jgi:hypothetical protein
MSRRVYTPSKAAPMLDEVSKLLYLLKTSIKTESDEKTEERINKIRGLLLEIKENIS